MLRCPLSGSSSIDIRCCPGFAPAPVNGGDIDGSSAAYVSCAHLGAETDARGFYPGCHHPEAEWIVEAAARMREREEVRGTACLLPSDHLGQRVVAAQSAAAFEVGRARMLVCIARDLAGRGSRFAPARAGLAAILSEP